jgi:hypothetical protein
VDPTVREELFWVYIGLDNMEKRMHTHIIAKAEGLSEWGPHPASVYLANMSRMFIDGQVQYLALRDDCETI